jgi:ribosome-binding protein aMBF1 (putative translation factor)
MATSHTGSRWRGNASAPRGIARLSPSRYSVRRMRPIDQARSATARSVGDRLRELRLEAGLTQVALAGRLGTTQSAIARLEAGGQRTSLEAIRRIADALGCDVALVIAQKRSA